MAIFLAAYAPNATPAIVRQSVPFGRVAQAGAAESARKLRTICGNTSSARSTSASVLKRPKEKRRLLRARSLEKCIARRTCDGCTAPVVQEEPNEQQIPSWSSLTRIAWAFTPVKARLQVLG